MQYLFYYLLQKILKYVILSKVEDWMPGTLLKLSFPRTILSHVKELPNGYFYYSYKVIIFQGDVFQNSYFWLLILKPIKSISEIQILTIENRRLKCFLGNCVFRSNCFAQYIFIISFIIITKRFFLSHIYRNRLFTPLEIDYNRPRNSHGFTVCH